MYYGATIWEPWASYSYVWGRAVSVLQKSWPCASAPVGPVSVPPSQTTRTPAVPQKGILISEFLAQNVIALLPCYASTELASLLLNTVPVDWCNEEKIWFWDLQSWQDENEGQRRAARNSLQAVSFSCCEISKRPTNPLSSLENSDELGVRKEMSHAESFHLGVAKMPIKVLLERADDEKVTKPRSTERGHDAPNSKVEIFCEQETNEKW